MAFHVSKTSILSTLDYIEDGRQDIYNWSETRKSNRKGISGKLYQFKKLFIDKSVLRSFVQNLTVIVLLQMVLAALATFICQKFELDFEVHVSIFVSPIVFPLAFSINADFQRRERVLEDLAQFKGALVVLFFCHRDWVQAAGLPPDFLKTVNTKLRGLVLNIKEYLLTEKVVRRNYILTVIYEDLSDISQLNDKMRASSLPHNSPLITRLIHYHNLMCHSFESLRVIREYRSPRTIRSFTKVFIFLMPIVLSPYYVHMGIKSGNIWSPYYIAVLTSFIFGTLQGVQDVLDDPFDGISEDDINLGQLEDWTAHSLLTNRIITIGRFTVTRKAKAKDTGQLESGSDSDSGLTPNPKMVQPVKVPQKRKPILKRASFRRVDHAEENAHQADRKKSLYPETAHRLEDLARRGMTGSTTILPGMKLKRSNSDSLTASNSRTSLAEFFRAQGMDDSGRESRDFKKVWFSDGQEDSDHEDNVFVSPLSHSAPSDYSRPGWLLDENTPLIVSDSRSGSQQSSETATSSLGTPEMGARGLPDELYEGLKDAPGTSLVNGRFSVDKKKSDAPSSLANLFASQPERTLDKTDGPSTSQLSQPQPATVPSSLQTLFGPMQNQDKDLPSSSSVVSPPRKTSRPPVLPISPLVRTDGPPTFRPQYRPYWPVVRISRSAPTSPEQERKWITPITPSPEDAVSIPLTSVPLKRSADFPLRKKSADMRFSVDSTNQTPVAQYPAQVAPVPLAPPTRKKSRDTSSGNSRFAVNSSAQTPDVQTSTHDPVSTPQRRESSGNSRFSVNAHAQVPVEDNSTQASQSPLTNDSLPTDSMGPSKPIDMPRSRFNVDKPSGNVTNPVREDQPLVTSGVPNYGVTDPSAAPSVLTTPPSRFQVNNPRKNSQDTERTRDDSDAEVVATRRDSFALLSLDGESTEVYI